MTFQFEYDNSHKTVAAGNVWDLSIILTSDVSFTRSPLAIGEMASVTH